MHGGIYRGKPNWLPGCLVDAPAGGAASERLIAKAGSAAEAYDTASSVMTLNASLWVSSNVVEIDAEA